MKLWMRVLTTQESPDFSHGECQFKKMLGLLELFVVIISKVKKEAKYAKIFCIFISISNSN